MQAAAFSALSTGTLVPTAQDALAFVPHHAPRSLPLDSTTIRLLARAEHRLGTLSGAAGKLVAPLLITAPLLRREAIVSSRIEHTIATPEQLALVELGATSRTPDAAEVGNFVKAIEYALVQVRKQPVSLGLMLETHLRLMRGVRGGHEQPGEFRAVQNFIGGSAGIRDARFVPPPHHELPSLLADLEHLINDDAADLPVLVRVAVAHYQFEAIHPFRDGNGRIGRLLILLMLVRGGLLPGPLLSISSAIDHRRAEYADRLLAVSTAGEWTAWLRFFLECVRESADEALGLLESLDRLRAKWHDRFLAARSSALLLKLVDSLFARPAITIGEARRLLRVTAASASANITKLERAGILVETTGRTRDRVYVAPAIIALVSSGPPGPSAGTVRAAARRQTIHDDQV